MRDIEIVALHEHPVITFACEELQRISASNGEPATVTRNTGNRSHAIIVGTWAEVRSCGIALTDPDGGSPSGVPANVQEDAFFIGALECCFVISGMTERATLFAVYRYCRERWGKVWPYPAEPVQMRRRQQAREKIAQQWHRPLIGRRGFVFESGIDVTYIAAMIDWLAKNEANEVFFTFHLWDQIKDAVYPEIIKRGLALTLGGHSLSFFLEGADTPHLAAQVDFREESWQEICLHRVVEYCKSIPALARLSLWPEDTAIHDDPELAASFLPAYIAFAEKAQRALRAYMPAIRVEHIAYNAGLSWSMLEPGDGQSASGSVDTLYAYWGRDYRTTMDSSLQSSDRRAHEALAAWKRATGKTGRQLTVFEYYSDHFMLSYLFPSFPRQIARDIAYYKGMGVDGITNLVVPNKGQADYSWQWAHGFHAFIFCRCAWGEPLEDALEAYYSWYGEEAETVRRWFQIVEVWATAITAWNVPLFPARAVDADKVADKTPYAEDIVHFCRRLRRELHPVVRDGASKYGQLAPDDAGRATAIRQAYSYMRHLYETAEAVAAAWETNHETK
ncbi:MAG: hypothetical protein J7639_26340 [Paenibacillaceae bacterium]|nr:hypothetical protein [Paenibacillaceae bacterium]